MTVTIDDRWFLPIPVELATAGDDERLAWARQEAATHLVDEAYPGDVAAAVAGFAELVADGASAAMLFCPDGLPGAALVEVFAVEAPTAVLAEIVDESAAALPRQVLPLGELPPETGRIVSTVRTFDGLTVGSLQHQLLRDGVLIDVTVTSPRLEALGAGMPLFEQLALQVEVDASASAEWGA